MQVYLDNAATGQIHEDVQEAIKPYLEGQYFNPSSGYKEAQKVREDIEAAREKIAKYIGADPSEIIFTSGATEANNLFIQGIAKANPAKKHIITSVIEHPAVLEVCEFLRKDGYKVDYIPVSPDGLVDPQEIKKKITKDTLFVSIMHVNNEIGTIQPIEEISKICQENKVPFHTDAVQSFRKIDINVQNTGISALSVSGHKVNAPKGIGFLYLKLGVNIKPLQLGGGQEFSFRSGTENVSGIIGLARATEVQENKEKIATLRDLLINELSKIPGAKLAGSSEKRVYNNANIAFYGISGEGIMAKLDERGIMASSGSACASHKTHHSHVLQAIGLDDKYVDGAIRLTLSCRNTEEEILYTIEILKKIVSELSEISPYKVKE